MTILVTGGNGFVGSNIVRRLLERGEKVTVMDAFDPDITVQDFLKPYLNQVHFITGDIRDTEFVLGAKQTTSIDYIIHAAAYSVPRIDIELAHARDIVDVNVMGTTNLCELARAAEVKRLVYVSTGSVYGNKSGSNTPVHEDSDCVPERLYGVTKYAGELVSRRYGDANGIDVRIARIVVGPYGPMERPNPFRRFPSLMYEWTKAALVGLSLQVTDMNYAMDTTFVSDTADAIVTILLAGNNPHPIYNVGTIEKHTFGEIVELITELMPGTNWNSIANDSWDGLPSHPGKTSKSSRCESDHDLTRLYSDLAWKPRYNLRTGLKTYLDWVSQFQDSQRFDDLAPHPLPETDPR